MTELQLPLKMLVNLNKGFTSKDKTRHYIKGVLIEVSEGKGYMVATNGHVIGVILFNVNEHTPDLQITLPSETLKMLGLKFKETDVATLTVEESQFTLTHECNSLTGSGVGSTFPDWRRVIPKRGYTPSIGYYGKKPLQDLRSISSTGEITIVQNGSADPAYVHYPNSEVFGIIMPTKPLHETTSKLPDWLFSASE